VVVTINGTKHWLWRAVDQHGTVLDVLVQCRRDMRYTRNGQMSSIATTYTYFAVASSSLTLAQMSSWKTLL
jgi:hypothetical protein